MKKVICFFLCLLTSFILSFGFAEKAAEYYVWPDAETPSIVLECYYPETDHQLISSKARSIVEAQWKALCDEAVLEDARSLPPKLITLYFAIQHDDGNLISMAVTEEETGITGTSTAQKGITFGIDGAERSLSEILPSAADSVQLTENVYDLVWDSLNYRIANGLPVYDEFNSISSLKCVFDPMTDYFLDRQGDPVFFIQEAVVAPKTEGILQFAFSWEEVLN